MTKNIYEAFGTSEELETKKGIELDFGSFSLQILRAGAKNKKYTKALKKHAKKYSRQIEKGWIEDEKTLEIFHKVYAESIVIGWKGVTDKSGKELPFTKENCLTLFKDLSDLFESVKEEAEKMTNFQEEAEEAKKK